MSGSVNLRKFLQIYHIARNIAPKGMSMLTGDISMVLFERYKPFWHVCTPGNLSGIIFRCEEDFIFGMNVIAMCASEFRNSVAVFTFVIMGNHLHFVLGGNEIDVRDFYCAVERRLKRHLHFNRGGEIAGGKGFEYSAWPVGDLRYLRNLIAYVNRNGYVAMKNHTPYTYLWGANRYFFNPGARCEQNEAVSNIARHKLRAIFRTRNVTCPNSYFFTGGYISPLCYCKIDEAEQFFVNANHYFNMISRPVESFSKIAAEIGDMVVYSDSELYNSTVHIMLKEFNIQSIRSLNTEQRIFLAKKLHFEFNASNKQIQRILGIGDDALAALFPTAK